MSEAQRAAVAERIAAFLGEPEAVTVESIDAAREVLAQLSARSEDGRLRDAIGEVRHALADWYDELEAEATR